MNRRNQTSNLESLPSRQMESVNISTKKYYSKINLMIMLPIITLKFQRTNTIKSWLIIRQSII